MRPPAVTVAIALTLCVPLLEPLGAVFAELPEAVWAVALPEFRPVAVTAGVDGMALFGALAGWRVRGGGAVLRAGFRDRLGLASVLLAVCLRSGRGVVGLTGLAGAAITATRGVAAGLLAESGEALE